MALDDPMVGVSSEPANSRSKKANLDLNILGFILKFNAKYGSNLDFVIPAKRFRDRNAQRNECIAVKAWLNALCRSTLSISL